MQSAINDEIIDIKNAHKNVNNFENNAGVPQRTIALAYQYRLLYVGQMAGTSVVESAKQLLNHQIKARICNLLSIQYIDVTQPIYPVLFNIRMCNNYNIKIKMNYILQAHKNLQYR
ncbi:Hypothetical_protein [Hexamita inflata]|uniref:Hypothetical_protein n=1 Tax=Hexamita inflata TaxID=28002 RepID=A0AA86QYB0_9EUKA|nr:Hypothetical protein HINF_LOCUS53142 [Hexamita inflata]